MTRTAVLAVILALLAAVAPAPAYLTDRDIYQEIGRTWIIPSCSSLHCTRVLVPWILEHLPGPSLLKWKAYAVAGSLAAAEGVAALAVAVGESTAVAGVAAAVTAFGGGAQLTLFDPYTSDPLVFALVPWMFVALLRGRIGLAVLAGAVGVWAKEFAAAPLWIFSIAAIVRRRLDLAVTAIAGAAAVSTIWIVLQLWFALRYNYSFAGSPSSQLLAGGYLVRWIRELGPVGAAAALLIRLGPLVVLAASEFRQAPLALRSLAIASVPAALLLGYVQQPDRALWNFVFVLAPLAALALAEGSPALRWPFLVGYALSNAHLGPATAWLEAPGWVVATIAMVGILWTRHRGARPVTSADDERLPRVRPPALRLCMAALTAMAASLAVVADVAEHRATERAAGLNVWGYRGPVAPRKAPNESRILVVGGTTAFGRSWIGSASMYLQDDLNNPRLQNDAAFVARGPITVFNLATPCDEPDAFTQTLSDYQRLDGDAVVVYLGDDRRCADAAGWRRSSAIFRWTGYLPAAPVLGARAIPASPLTDDAYLDAVDRVAAFARERRMRVAVVTHPIVPGTWDRRRRLLAHRFEGRDPTGLTMFVDLSKAVEPSSHIDEDIGEQLSQSIFRLLSR